MTYGAAVHGAWCGARTYPTRCNFCGQAIFYFHCNCGSKVFFSKLGDDWPEHRCLEMMTATYGKEFVRAGMSQQMMKHPGSRIHTSIERRYEEAVLKQFEKRKKGGTWLKRVDASVKAAVRDTAIVREVILDIDVFARLGVALDSTIGKGFLGIFAKEPYGQITFHIGHLPKGEVESYTAFTPGRNLKKLALQNGDLVTVVLKGIAIGPKTAAWLCAEVKFLND